MIQKLLTVGSSKAVTIPKNTLKELGLLGADSVSVKIDSTRKQLIVESVASVDGELVAWTKKFVKRYRPALKALAQK